MSAAATTADTPSPPKGGRKKLIIIVAAVLLLVLIGGGAALMLMKKKAAADADEDGEPRAEQKAEATKRDPKSPPAYVPLDAFVVNLADRDAERYAQIGITLEMVDAKEAEGLKVFMPAIRNNILMVLAHKTSAELLEKEGKVKLAGEVQRAASRALGITVAEPGEAKPAAKKKAADADAEADAEDEDKPKKKKKKPAPQPQLPIVAVHFSNFIVQ